MKEIVYNQFTELHHFSNDEERTIFLKKNSWCRQLVLSESKDEEAYCLVFKESFSWEITGIISFNSFLNGQYIYLLHWSEANFIALQTGRGFFLINKDLEVVFHEVSIMCTTLYITPDNKLLVLDEMGIIVIAQNGEVLINDNLPDIPEDYWLTDNRLHIKIMGSEEVVEYTL